MNDMLSNSRLKSIAKEDLSGNWLTAILLMIIFGAISTIVSFIPRVGTFLNLFIAGPLTLGLIGCFLNLVRSQEFKIEDLFDGFSNFNPALVAYMLKLFFGFLWTLLLVIPGIIAYYRYSMAFYILADNPEFSGKEAIDRSIELMDGHKAQLFLLHLSFIGWAILAIITFGLGFLWLGPYIQTAQTEFYQSLKRINSEQEELDNSEPQELDNPELNLNLEED